MVAVHKAKSTPKAASKQRPDTIRNVAPRPTVVLVPALRYWRTKRALLQRELADKAGVHRDTVRRAEDPDQPHAIRLDVVRRLAEALEVSPDRLQEQPPEG